MLLSMPNAVNLLLRQCFELLLLKSKAFSPRLVLFLGPSPCDSNPCQNGALCMEDLDSFICDCPFGFDGSLCQSLIGEIMALLSLNTFNIQINRH